MLDDGAMRGVQSAVINTLLLKRDLFHFLDSLAADAQPVRHVALLGGSFWLVNHPSAVRQVLTAGEHAIGKPEFLLQSNRGQHGDGLSSLSGCQWQARRRVMVRAFPPALVARVGAEARAATLAMVAQWRCEAPVDLAEQLARLVARIGARWILSADLADTECDAAIPWSEAAGVRYRVDAPGVAGDLMPPLRLRAGAVPVLRKRILARWRERRDTADLIGAMQDSCLAQDVTLSDDALVDEILQMLFASHHTVTTTLIQSVDFMHRHPGHADRLKLCARADTADRKVSSHFIKEAMRLCMPTALLFRQARQAQTIAQHTVAPGALLVISPYLLHRNAAHFPRPLAFEPQRFDAPVDPYAYLPFGAGARHCVAQRVAMLQMQSVIETLALTVRIVPLDPAPTNRFALSYPGPRYPVHIEVLGG